MSSQHPYAEDFIGKPHVWTVDYNNSEEFEAAIKTIMRTQVRLGGGVGVVSPLLGLQGQTAAVLAGAQFPLLSVSCFSFPASPWRLFARAEQKILLACCFRGTRAPPLL